MLTSLLPFCWMLIALLVGAGILHLIPRLGQAGRRIAKACCRAPLLDAIVCYSTILPLVVGTVVAGWRGFLGAALTQLIALWIWQTIHEIVHREAVKGPRIITVLNKKFGAFRNLTA